MEFNCTEIDNLDDDIEDVGFIDNNGDFTPAVATSRVPIPRITTMAHKNRGSLAPPVPQPQPARKVTYDDILSSLNMKVVDGKLQIIRNVNAENVKANNFNPQKQQQQQQQQQQPQQQHQTKFIPTQSPQSQNFQSNQSKRFQSMHQQEIQPVPILTKQQYRQVQIANYIKEVQRIQHIRNSKSTKLQFTNTNANTNPNFNISPLIGNTNDLNKLFPLKGLGNR